MPGRCDAAYLRRMTHAPGARASESRSTILAALGGCALGGGERVGGGPGADTSVVTMVTPFGRNGDSEFVDEVSRLSDGRLELRVVASEHTGTDYEAATIRDVLDGSADVAMVGARAWDEFGAPGDQRTRRTVPRRQLRTAGACPHQRPRRDDAPGAAFGPGGDRHPARAAAPPVRHGPRPGGSQRLPRPGDRHPAVRRGRRDHARARRTSPATPSSMSAPHPGSPDLPGSSSRSAAHRERSPRRRRVRS